MKMLKITMVDAIEAGLDITDSYVRPDAIIMIGSFAGTTHILLSDGGTPVRVRESVAAIVAHIESHGK